LRKKLQQDATRAPDAPQGRWTHVALSYSDAVKVPAAGFRPLPGLKFANAPPPVSEAPPRDIRGLVYAPTEPRRFAIFARRR